MTPHDRLAFLLAPQFARYKRAMSGIRHFPPIALALLVLTMAAAAPLVLGFLKDLHPALDSFAHFRAHLAALVAVLALPLLFTQLRVEGLAAMMLAAGAFATVLGISPLDAFKARKAGAEVPAPAAARYRLLQLNLRYDNAAPERALSVIGRSQADVVTLNEVSPMWRGKLALLEKAYPHRIICDPPTPTGGVAILSRRPFASDREPACHDRGSLAVAHIDFGGQEIDVAALHLGWPWPFAQHAQVSDIAQPLGALGETALLAGDFNAAPWSATTARVAAAGGLTLVEGVRPTWLHRAFPDALRRIAGLPIDQVLRKGRITVRSARTLDGAGSDHLPVLVEFSIEPGPAEPAVQQAIALSR